MKEVPTYTASIYCGLRAGYDRAAHPLEDAAAVCQAFVDEIGLGVTLTPTQFLYTDGNEPGVIVGLINYPRFPSTPERVRELAIELAKQLMQALEQFRVSIVFPDKTVMLGEV